MKWKKENQFKLEEKLFIMCKMEKKQVAAMFYRVNSNAQHAKVFQYDRKLTKQQT